MRFDTADSSAAGCQRKAAHPFAPIAVGYFMLSEVFDSNSFDILPHVVAMLVAYALAVPIGWNREREERSAGLRTFPLVALATCGFIQATETLTADSPEAMARITEGLIVGMGFIGGGAILRHEASVQGTATAASLWVTGAIGVAVGLGSYDVAVVLAIATIATLWIMAPLKRIGNLDEKQQQAADDKRDSERRRQSAKRR